MTPDNKKNCLESLKRILIQFHQNDTTLPEYYLAQVVEETLDGVLQDLQIFIEDKEQEILEKEYL